MSTSANRAHPVAAFTLVELILVMVLLATLLAIVAPSLSRSFKGRALDQEATRLLAATEYARSEAVSQGLPMNLWIDPVGGTFGVQAKDGNTGNPSREQQWALPGDIRFDLQSAATDTAGHIIAATFDPEGTLATGNLSPLVLIHRSGDRVSLTQTDDGWGYEIAP
ncbi:MAG: GspH/FimT family pseudopilin [Chthoniobacteraceae bacterium]|nr:GspH/FimT family pseudopilin [Chthoniobacteraceae bacterium]